MTIFFFSTDFAKIPPPHTHTLGFHIMYVCFGWKKRPKNEQKKKQKNGKRQTSEIAHVLYVWTIFIFQKIILLATRYETNE